MAPDQRRRGAGPGPGTDPDLFEEFYRRHVEAIGGFVARRVTGPQMAADLTAEVFLAALKGAAGYDTRRGSEIGWLYGIARNVIAAELRGRQRVGETEARWVGRRELGVDDIGQLEDRISAESTVRRLGSVIARLPEGERAVLELVAMDGLRVADAAAALGISQPSARIRLFRARRSLRARLDAEENAPSRAFRAEAVKESL